MNQEIKFQIPGFEVIFRPTSPNLDLRLNKPTIQSRVQEYMGEGSYYKLTTLMKKCRSESLVRARWKIFKKLKDEGYPLQDIADFFGLKDDTVRYGIHRIDGWTPKKMKYAN